jgi:Flp pilus assembly protein TadD
MVLSPGYVLGHYEIRSLLDKGGMGEVYLAYDQQLRRRVALKLLPAEFTQDEERLGRFEKEAYAASRLNHPNIITIHEIGEQDGHHYMATEYVEGKNLSEHMAHARMDLRQILAIASQTASALTAAHQASVVHRDIKPKNIMVRSDGYIKVLDFGLAKLVSQPSAGGQEEVDRDAPTLIKGESTKPGVILGTTSYMSPEQIKGGEVDARTDIWSLGVVLYEMVAGRLPFEGRTATDVLMRIMHHEPPSLMLYSSEVPAELERIVEKALAKDREERYQLARELGLDLSRLKQHMELEAELERSVPPEGVGQGGRKHEGGEGRSATASATPSPAAEAVPQGVGLVGRLKSHKKVAALTLAALVIAAFLVTSFYRNNNMRLTGEDQILLADFENTTGDVVFDGPTLKTALSIQLAQSPFINIVPAARLSDHMLLRIDRSRDERITKAVARQICERYGIKAFVTGSVSKYGSTYTVTLEALNGKNGEPITDPVQENAPSIEGVLGALTRAAKTLRGNLGESLASIENFDVPLDLTTKSNAALQAFSQGYELSIRGNHEEAIKRYAEATRLDPPFAYAYSGLAAAYSNTNRPELAAKNATKAYDYAKEGRVSKLEQLRINYFYYGLATGQLTEAIDTLQEYKRTYPNDYRAPSNLSDRYLASGQFEKAKEEAKAALLLNPDAAPSHGNLGLALLGLSKFGEAKEVCERALGHPFEASYFHGILYQVAFFNKDTAGRDREVAWANSNRNEFMAKDWQTQAAAFAGRWREAAALSLEAVRIAEQKENPEAAAQAEVDQALRGAAFGFCGEVKAGVDRALNNKTKWSLVRGALALNLCGYKDKAQASVAEIEKRFDKDTLVKDLWLPTIRAASEINSEPLEAIRLLETARTYEAAGEFWPQYLRGLAYLKSKQNEKATVEFQNILSHRGQSTISILYPLASLHLARATAGIDASRSRNAYLDFLDFWAEADANISLLSEAKREYAKVK